MVPQNDLFLACRVPASAAAAHNHAHITHNAAVHCFNVVNAQHGYPGGAGAGETHAFAGFWHLELPPPVDRPRARIDEPGPDRHAEGLRARVLREHFPRRTAPVRTRNKPSMMPRYAPEPRLPQEYLIGAVQREGGELHRMGMLEIAPLTQLLEEVARRARGD